MKQSDIEKQKALARELAESSLENFIALVHPQRVLGAVHRELIQWWEREEAKSHQLVLLPRDHGKSAMIAYRVAHAITKNPAVRVLYVSSTSGLAIKQVKAIKDILTSDRYRFYWPEMVNEVEGRREKWTESEFSVDHPLRKAEAIRDSTCFAAGLTTSVVGLHCDIAVLDDVVVIDNAYTQEGRDKVEQQYSLLSSIEGADAQEWVVGTRYHPKDLYGQISGRTVDFYSPEGDKISEEPLFEVFERQVEDHGDGTGQFLWPRQQRYDGKWFGFDQNILATKRAQYMDKTQFRAQYYNNPNDLENSTIQRGQFQYYDQRFIRRQEGRTFFKDRRLNVFAAVDFAYSLKKKADFSSIVVIGVDGDKNYYVLEIDRFKTTMISEYFEHIFQLHKKWDFRKLRAEVNAAQAVIVNDLKQNYIRPYGLALTIEESRPNRHQGTKEERVNAVLQPRYANGQIWHYAGGNCQILEEELVQQNPPHDDVKDCLASVIETAIPPSPLASSDKAGKRSFYQHAINPRFGGMGL